ncbi:hypothetical protein BCR39DRAFT_209968 [Naematelia encephala]|uniref:Uncharacterized protein n=1 Tax=Naematelia encephala TaxID=71784 RepID=A0A1Y2B010_9TREE|nr:hypothetical protein BCR39DRAFT_209968 [Naematelia encephala]
MISCLPLCTSSSLSYRTILSRKRRKRKKQHQRLQIPDKNDGPSRLIGSPSDTSFTITTQLSKRLHKVDNAHLIPPVLSPPYNSSTKCHPSHSKTHQNASSPPLRRRGLESRHSTRDIYRYTTLYTVHWHYTPWVIGLFDLLTFLFWRFSFASSTPCFTREERLDTRCSRLYL